MTNPVFILSLFDTGYYAARLLKNTGATILGFDHDSSNPGFFSSLINPFLVPHPQKEPEKLYSFLLSKRGDFKEKPILIPASELYLSFVQSFRSKLEKEFIFCIPSHDVLSKILNKSVQFELAKEASIAVPKYENVTTPEDLQNVPNKLNLPIIIKSLDQSLWKINVKEKAFLISNNTELLKTGSELLNRNVAFIAQELISGPITNNYEFNALMVNGKFIHSHIIRKIQQYPLGFGAACCIEVVKNEIIEKLGLQFIESNKIEGFSNTEFKYDSLTGNYYFIETNARVWQQIELTNKMGENIMESFYACMTKHTLPEKISIHKENILWIDLPAFLLLYKRYRQDAGLSFSTMFRTVISACNFGLLHLSDLKPFIYTVLIKKKRK